MKDRIDKLLAQRVPLKAREIARKLGFARDEVNSFLHSHPEDYKQDDEYRWSRAKEHQLTLTLPNDWVSADAFEDVLSGVGPILDGPFPAVRINFPSRKCRPMIDCTARLLALANQLVDDGKNVTVDFTDARATLSYLDRAGFFGLLAEEVTVLPERPLRSAAMRYEGQSDTLVEFGPVDPKSDNTDLVKKLTEKFVRQSSTNYRVVALTVFGEMIGNVREHSNSPLHGFAGLQRYKGRRKHIQTVITDSGVGIANTLRPALSKHYQVLLKRFGVKSLEADMGLVVAAMTKGGISRFGEGRGLGFKSSREQATKFDASFSVRQEEFCLRFDYRNGQLVKVHKKTQLSKLRGTHICFDFYVD